MKTTRPLRTALLANAAFSTVCALLLLTVPTVVGVWLGIQATLILRLLGCGLLIFAVDLVHQVMRPRLVTWRALYASVGDFLWVMASVLGLLLFPGLFSRTGVAMVLAVAGIVLTFGIWQLWGIDRTHRVENTALYRHCLVVHTEASASAMWSVVERMGDIRNYAPWLLKSDILEGKRPGVGTVRHCVDQSGRSWTEECVDFEPGHSFTVRFVSEAPDFPFPARTMVGGWKVMSAATGSDVMVWWEISPKPRLLATVLLPVLAVRSDHDFVGVIRRMANKATLRKQDKVWLLPRFC